MKKIRTLALLAIICILASCKQPLALTYQGVSNFSLKGADVTHPAIGMDLRFYNPNNYVLKLKHADIDVYINGNHLGQMILDTLYDIPRLDTCSIPVVLNVDTRQVFPNALQLLLSKGVDVKIKGNIKAGRKGIYLNIPVAYEGTQQLNINM
jgi:hypothetical protein